MDKILFVTQTLGHRAGCGIGLIGKLIAESLVKSKKYSFEILYTDSAQDLEDKIALMSPRTIIYNYHSTTTPWLYDSQLRNRLSDIPHIMLHHDITQGVIDSYHLQDHGFKYLITADNTLNGNENVFTVNRLMPPYIPSPYIDRGIPVIGFQGFGFRHKGIHKIAERVCQEFDEAIIRLHIPYSFFGDQGGWEARHRVNEVRDITRDKQGIKIEASHDLMSTGEVIEFLGQNTINCYFYDYLDGAGLASSPDYALAANRPIAVTKSHQLRNFLGINPSVCIEDNSLKDIISFGLKPLEELRNKYSEENVLKDYEHVIDSVLKSC